MKPDHGPLIYEGKAKRIFSTANPDQVLVHFKNDATAFNAQKHQEFDGKGALNCQISSAIFEMLKAEGVPTHYLGLISEDWLLAQKVDVIPLEVVIRNVATGSLCRETPINEGIELSPPLLDLYYKDDQLGDPLLTEARLKLLQLITSDQRKGIESLARRVNELLTSFFLNIDLLLVDFKLELGVNCEGQLLIADEISPDTCRIWDKRNLDSEARILDKDRFRKGLGGLTEGYGQILKRIQGV